MKYSRALDEKYAALALSRRVAPRHEAGNSFKKAYGYMERMALRSAESYWWDSDIADVVIQSSRTLPTDMLISRERLLSGERTGWMFFERPIVLAGLESFSAILWFVQPDETAALWVTTYGVRDSGACESMTSSSLLRDITISDFVRETQDSDVVESVDAFMTAWGGEATSRSERNGCGELIRFFVAARLWTQQSIVAVANRPVDRHTKKRALRVQPDAECSVRVVLLRRKDYGPSDGESRPVEWSCRWLVSGHWRNQYHQSTGERVPTWIMPYVKGPEDKPLKAPSPTVYAVTR